MGGSSQQNEDVPDGMEVAAVVVGEEVGTAGVEEAFGQKEEEREGGESLIYALCMARPLQPMPRYSPSDRRGHLPMATSL